MSQGLVERQNLEDIADAIRSKNGSSDTYTPAEMAQAISGIRTADEVVLVQKTVNANGQYNASDDSADGYSGVRVNVPNSYSASDEGKVVSNGTLVAQTTKQITTNGTHDTTTNNSVSVDVPNSYTTSDNGKVVVNQALVAQTSKNIIANGTHDTTANNSVVVDVPNSYVAADEGKVVSGGALVGQTSRNVTVNGTYDTTENNEVVVNVSGGGTLIQKTITQNGTYNASDDNADGYSSVTVNVSGGDDSFSLTDYIESSGTQYIDTGYLVKDDTEFEMVVNFSNTGNYPTIFGVREVSRTDASGYGAFICSRWGGSDYAGINWGSSMIGTPSLQNHYGKKSLVKFAKGKKWLFESEDGYYVASYFTSTTSATQNFTLYIFTLNTGGNIEAVNWCTMKLYRFRIYESGSLVHEFIPWKDSNDVVCLKDTQTGNLFYNAGTGVFAYGTDGE